MIDDLSPAARELLESTAVATVATINANGSRKLRNLRRDPRIALSIQGDRVNEWGLQEYLVIEGAARITQGGAAALLQRLARTYLGPDVVFPAMANPPPGYVTRVKIERVRGIGPWLTEDAAEEK